MIRVATLVLCMSLSGAAVAAGGASPGGSGGGQPAPGGQPSAGPAPTGDALRQRLIGRWSPDSAEECTSGEGAVFFSSGGLLITDGGRTEREGIGTWTVDGATLTMVFNRRSDPAGQPDTLTFAVTQDFGTYLQGDLGQRGRSRQEQLYRCP